MQTDRLTIAISTIGRRMADLSLPPATPEVAVLVLLQSAPSEATNLLAAPRPDVRVVALDGTGVARSRNAALDLAQSEFLLFADDDVTLDMAGVQDLEHHLRAHPDLDMIAGRLLGPGRRTLAAKPHALRLTNSGHIGTPQLMIRLDRIRARGIRFDTRFGLGSTYPLGEEFIFVTDALKAGLRGAYLPVSVGIHPTESTGDNWSSPDLLRGRAAALRRVFGWKITPFALAFALRHRRRIGGAKGMASFVALCHRRP